MENNYDMTSPFSCGCVGYAYVPVQNLTDTYAVDTALCQGTVFPELDLSICEYGAVCKKEGQNE